MSGISFLRLFTLALAVVLSLTVPGRAEVFVPALKPADLDPNTSASYRGDARQPVDDFTLAGALGFTKQGQPRWGAPPRRGDDDQGAVRFVVAFRREVTIGSLLLPAGFDVALLNPGATADPAKAEAWTALASSRSLSGGRLVTLDKPTAVHALLLTGDGSWGTDELRYLRLYANRNANLTPWALAYADREFRPPNTYHNPWPASAVTTGKGHWVNVGKDQTGFIPAPAVSDIAPSWFLLAWNKEQTIEGLWLHSNITKETIEVFDGPSHINPRAGTPAEWRKVKDVTETSIQVSAFETVRWLAFPRPVRSRGLRLTITKTAEGPIALIKGLHAVTDLGNQRLPAAPAVGEATVPPFGISYRLEEDRNLTLVINDQAGRRVRTLVTRGQATKGEHVAGWDLKDDAGRYVGPGDYTWTALAWPDLQVKYETTVYPNVPMHAPGNSPWLNGHHGPGGWMADHTPPICGCVAGDRVFLGSSVAESGVSLIECDLDGRKTWGYHSFAAWTGPRFLAADQKEVFIGNNILGSPTEAVWAVDLATHKVRNVLTLNPTANRKRGLQGLAARDGKLYLSVRGSEAWLTDAAAGDDVDSDACQPLYQVKRAPRVAYEAVPDPRGDFIKLFRLAGAPPGGATAHSLSYIESLATSRPKQFVVLSFKKPIPLGSVVYPPPTDKSYTMTISVLKPGAPFPPNPEEERHWLPFAGAAKLPWDVVAAPPNTLTRAVRLTFARTDRGSDDPLDTVGDGPKPKKDDFPDLDKPKTGGKDVLDFGKSKGNWKGQLEGMKLLRRRFENVAGQATVRVSSGKVGADGVWDAQRTEPLTEMNPGVYLLEWQTAQHLRGLAVKEIDGELTKVDVFTGAPGVKPDLQGMEGWTTIAEYRQSRREWYSPDDNHNSLARYLDGNIDFGKEVTTRAVRLRVVQQWADRGSRGTNGLRKDLGGDTVAPTRCRIYGVAALKYIGGEPPVDAAVLERIEVYDAASGKLASEIPIEQPGEIAFDAAGALHALSGKRIVKVDPTGGKHQPVVADLLAPSDFAFDAAGRCYVFDGGKDRQNVRVYDGDGKYLRAIGTPGGFKTGPWDPTRMGEVTSIDVDQRGQLWVVETQYHPKRVTVWSTDGQFKKELLGNTPYGGGGVLDPWDKSRLFHGPLEFAIDWKTGQSSLKNLTWLGPTRPGERPFHIDGRLYLTTRIDLHEMPCAIVYRYDNGRAILAAAMGVASAFEPLKSPDVIARLGGQALTTQKFLWTDRNGDGQVQVEEVRLTPRPKDYHGFTMFDHGMGVMAHRWRYEIKEFLPSGVPVYEEKEYPALKGRYFYKLDNGRFYRIGEQDNMEAVVDAEGRPFWTYPNEGNPGTHASQTAKPYRPNQVVAQFGLIGHEQARELGEFVLLHTNTGVFNVWTADGLLVGPIFKDFRTGKARPWSMPEHDRGLTWNDLTIGEEHFNGFFCQSKEDGKFYAVAGHNHISVLEVLGLDRFQRLNGTTTVTADDVRKAVEFDSRKQSVEVFARAPVLDAFQVAKPPAFDGRLSGFPGAGANEARIPEGDHETDGAEFRLCYDDKNLYVGWRTRNMGPLKNSGQDWQRLFKTGAAVDLHLETDPTAEPARQAPVAGDVRLLFASTNDGPRLVLYRPVRPGTPPERTFRVTSPVGATVIDEVTLLKQVRMVRSGDERQYTVEAAVPLSALGLKLSPGLRLKLDWGVLVAGPGGTEVLRRVYWANRGTQIVSDAPTEARLTPHLWGHVVFHGVFQGDEQRLSGVETGEKKGKEVKKDVDDLLDELKPKK